MLFNVGEKIEKVFKSACVPAEYFVFSLVRLYSEKKFLF